MNEPATKDDLERAKQEIVERLSAVDKSVEGMRSQNSAEHGTIFSKLSHIGAMMLWLKQQWERFMRS